MVDRSVSCMFSDKKLFFAVEIYEDLCYHNTVDYL